MPCCMKCENKKKCFSLKKIKKIRPKRPKNTKNKRKNIKKCEKYYIKYKKRLDFKKKSLYPITNEVTDKGVKQLVSYCLSSLFFYNGKKIDRL